MNLLGPLRGSVGRVELASWSVTGRVGGVASLKVRRFNVLKYSRLAKDAVMATRCKLVDSIGAMRLKTGSIQRSGNGGSWLDNSTDVDGGHTTHASSVGAQIVDINRSFFGTSVKNVPGLVLHHLNDGIFFTERRVDEWRNQIGQCAFRVINLATFAAKKSFLGNKRHFRFQHLSNIIYQLFTW